MMKLKYWLVGGCLSVGLVVLDSPSIAKTANQCVAGQPTPESYTYNFTHEANAIFRDLRTDAARTADQAAFLQRNPEDLNLLRNSDGSALSQLRDSVNDMGERLCRLQAIRRVLEPQQQQVVDQVAAKVPLLATSTEDAILFVNTSQYDLWSPTFQQYVNNIYNDATALRNELKTATRG